MIHESQNLNSYCDQYCQKHEFYYDIALIYYMNIFLKTLDSNNGCDFY